MPLREESIAMNNDDQTKVLLGEITSAQGIKGQVKIRSYTDIDTELFSYTLILKNGTPAPAVRLNRVLRPGVLIGAIDGVTSRTQAEAFKGTKLFTLRSAMPVIESDSFYTYDLVGLSVRDENDQTVGVVKQVHNFGAGDFFDITQPDKTIASIPFHKDAVLSLDQETRIMRINSAFLLLPPGHADKALLRAEEQAEKDAQGEYENAEHDNPENENPENKNQVEKTHL